MAASRCGHRRILFTTFVVFVVALLNVDCHVNANTEGDGVREFFISRKRSGGKEGRRLSSEGAVPRRILDSDSDTGFKEVGFTYRENDGVYWADLRIGSPQQDFSVIVDTGSSTIAIPCKGCSCGSQHHYFDRAASSSSTIKSSNGYRQCYSEGSCNSGDMLKDKLCIGNACTPVESVEHEFGCCNTFASAFQKQEADGIIGLSLNRRTLVADLQEHHRLKADAFALCFGATKGVLVVGGYPEDRHMEPIQWTPMTQKSGEFYNVKVSFHVYMCVCCSLISLYLSIYIHTYICVSIPLYICISVPYLHVYLYTSSQCIAVLVDMIQPSQRDLTNYPPTHTGDQGCSERRGRGIARYTHTHCR
jgi:hypothetical protein